METIENICFEGGGIKVIAFAGALKVLDNIGVLSKVKRFIGSSGGAIVATLLVCGYTIQELENILSEDFEIFKDTSGLFILDFYRLFTRFGYYKGNKFEEWMGDKIAAKTGSKDITFKQLYEKSNKTLVVTGSCVNKRQTHYYHYQSNASMPVKRAVRISMGIPLFMQSVVWDGDILIDGGVFDNYPITYFDGIDNQGNLPDSRKGIVHLNEELSDKTIGLKLLSTGEQSNNGYVFQGNDNIRNIKDFLIAIASSYCSHIENLYIKPGYWERTISINTGNIKATDFNLSTEDKDFLVAEGKKGVDKYLLKYSSV